MRVYDLYWKSNKNWWFYDGNLIPRLKVTAPPVAQKSYVRYRLQKGCSVCDVCPRMKESVYIGKCPNCGADGLLMSVQTHMAVCDFCGGNFAIPLAIPGLCHNDVLFGRYEFTFSGNLAPETILAASKILGTNTVQLYKAIKAQTPIKRNLTYRESLALKALLLPTGITFTISPELIEYEKYKECWSK